MCPYCNGAGCADPGACMAWLPPKKQKFPIGHIGMVLKGTEWIESVMILPEINPSDTMEAPGIGDS